VKLLLVLLICGVVQWLDVLTTTAALGRGAVEGNVIFNSLSIPMWVYKLVGVGLLILTLRWLNKLFIRGGVKLSPAAWHNWLLGWSGFGLGVVGWNIFTITKLGG